MIRLRTGRRRLVRWPLVVTLGVGLTAASLTATPVAAQVVDLTVSGVEVTQAIQTTGNTIQLLAQRSTAVRATIGITGTAAPLSGVTGQLHVFVNGVEISPVGGLAPINAPLTAPLSPLRGNENDTLNFELAAPTGIIASSDVDFRVDVTPVPGEANVANNSGAASNLAFVNRTTPSLFFTRIDYTPSGLGLPALGDVQAGRGDAFVRGIYPINDGDANLYRQGLFPTLAYGQDDNGNGILNTSPEGNNLLSLLSSCRQLIVDRGLGATNATFLYGWIAGNPIEGNGLGQISGFNAFGNTQGTRYQRTYAHELGHNVGIGPHNIRFLDEVGWDVGARLAGNPAGNNTTGRVKRTSLRDIMVGGELTNSAWVDTTTYNFFLSGSSLPSLLSSNAQQQEFEREVLVVEGVFDRQGERLLRLERVFRYPWLSEPTSPESEGRYQVTVLTEQGDEISRFFDPGVHDDGKKDRELFGYFEVMVPAEGQQVASLEIVDLATEEIEQRLGRSESPPDIRIVSPQPESRLGRKTKVIWKVSDSDTKLSRLRFQAAYSPDNGESFVPIGVDLRGNSFRFNSRQIQASDGTGLIRVFVSDGLNTSFDDVVRLSTLKAKFRAP